MEAFIVALIIWSGVPLIVGLLFLARWALNRIKVDPFGPGERWR